MSPDLKSFYRLQYQWIRLPHPSHRIAIDTKHPLHQMELEVSHNEPIINSLIQDLLAKGSLFKYEDVVGLESKFRYMRSQLDLMDNTEDVVDYKQYLDRTLELLNSAAKLLAS